MIRVALVDDDALIRAGLRMILEQAGDIEVVATGGDGRQAVRIAREIRPDVMLVDIRMPNLDGIEATRQILSDLPQPGSVPASPGRSDLPQPGSVPASPGRLTRPVPEPDAPRIIILTTFELDEYVFQALRAGASGFLLKRTEPERLVDAVRVVAQGEALLSPSVTRRLIDEFSKRPAAVAPERLAELTEREREVLLCIAGGLSNKELAERLVIADNTVKTHVKRILTKLGARDRAQAIVIAYESGLMS